MQILIGSLLILITSLVNAAPLIDQIGEKVCSKKSDVCIEYISDTIFEYKVENRFKIVLDTSDYSDLKVEGIDLWMQMGNHGHGSSPVSISEEVVGTFNITKAYFVMKGTWQIRVHIIKNKVKESLIFFVKI